MSGKKKTSEGGGPVPRGGKAVRKSGSAGKARVLEPGLRNDVLSSLMFFDLVEETQAGIRCGMRRCLAKQGYDPDAVTEVEAERGKDFLVALVHDRLKVSCVLTLRPEGEA